MNSAVKMRAACRRLVEAKLASFHSVFFPPQHSTRAYEHSGFILRLILDGGQIKFEPDFPDFELVLINVFDVMIKNVGMIPRVETKLYSEWVSTHHLSKGLLTLDQSEYKKLSSMCYWEEIQFGALAGSQRNFLFAFAITVREWPPVIRSEL